MHTHPFLEQRHTTFTAVADRSTVFLRRLIMLIAGLSGVLAYGPLATQHLVICITFPMILIITGLVAAIEQWRGHHPLGQIAYCVFGACLAFTATLIFVLLVVRP